mmetsp:Transcript_31660/g.56669  ORF Transcript_31660/g.56669 Transcript_31660/m.56669 type:complete len:269 (-) Transcript_31660:1084-1890(-)
MIMRTYATQPCGRGASRCTKQRRAVKGLRNCPIVSRRCSSGSVSPVRAAADPEASMSSVPMRRGPPDEMPDYSAIDSTPVNRAVMALFRRKMAAVVGADSALPGYDGIVELTWMLNTKFPSAEATQAATLGILLSLMPSWLPALFKVMFAQPFPALSNSMNAYITMLTCQWLMGKCTVNDVELPDGQVKSRWGMKVERCRYLEAAGCASVCMNSCKVPTQTFFKEAMGIDLEMTPNYDDFSCQCVHVPPSDNFICRYHYWPSNVKMII